MFEADGAWLPFAPLLSDHSYPGQAQVAGMTDQCLMLVVPGTREVSPRLLPHSRATPGSMVKLHQETFVPATASHIFLYTTNRA